MSRHISKSGNDPHVGVILCTRPRCRERFTWELEHQYNGYASFSETRQMTDEQLAERKEQDRQAWAEVYNKPLPANWVRLVVFEYMEGTGDKPELKEFHSPHCAALYLNSLKGFRK